MPSTCSPRVCAYGRICVPSVGPCPAEIMCVAEAPGYVETQRMRPLVGPAGQRFDRAVSLAELQREDLYLANTVGCVDFDREIRKPTPDEMAACHERLMADVFDRARPKVIVVLGGTALGVFFPGFERSVGKIRGTIRAWQGIPTIATYHPAASLMHRYGDPVLFMIVEDLVRAKEFARG